MKHAFREATSVPLRATIRSLLTALTLGALAACGGDDDNAENKPASQVAAKVNKEELSVHQVNYVLQRQPGLAPEDTTAASRIVLERLIDQELALQKAEESKIDRSPRVLQAMEAARREIVARAYLEAVGEAAQKPSDSEIRAYYEANPALFSERRIYSFQEIAIESKPEQADMLREKLKASKTVNEFLDYLKANNIRFAGSQAVRAAEQLPLNTLPTVAKMKDGESMFNVLPSGGVQVVVLAGSRSQPVDVERATPAIEQFLLNERKRKLIEQDMKALRSAAQIEYVGQFAEGAASAPRPEPVAAPATPASAGLDIEKGLKGLK